MKDTKIQWAHDTFNPWWGCVEAGPECDNCYARQLSDVRQMRGLWGAAAPRRTFGDAHWREPLKWNRAAAEAGERRRVFCASMADVLEDRRDLDAPRERLWDLIEATPSLDWMLLTKRPSKFATLTPERWRRDGWPRNVWAGTSAGTQRTADVLIPQLLRAASGASVRFVSAEPLLELVDYSHWLYRLGHCEGCGEWERPDPALGNGHDNGKMEACGPMTEWRESINLLILGGESGARGTARPLDPAWIRAGIAQARAAGCKAFVKQMGRWVLGDHAGFTPDHFLLADGRGWVPPLLPSRWYRPAEAVGFSLSDSHGGDPEDWPEDLRVREMPEVAA